jgi:hypothetical protein
MLHSNFTQIIASMHSKRNKNSNGQANTCGGTQSDIPVTHSDNLLHAVQEKTQK